MAYILSDFFKRNIRIVCMRCNKRIAISKRVCDSCAMELARAKDSNARDNGELPQNSSK